MSWGAKIRIRKSVFLTSFLKVGVISVDWHRITSSSQIVQLNCSNFRLAWNPRKYLINSKFRILVHYYIVVIVCSLSNSIEFRMWLASRRLCLKNSRLLLWAFLVQVHAVEADGFEVTQPQMEPRLLPFLHWLHAANSLRGDALWSPSKRRLYPISCLCGTVS